MIANLYSLIALAHILFRIVIGVLSGFAILNDVRYPLIHIIKNLLKNMREGSERKPRKRKLICVHNVIINSKDRNMHLQFSTLKVPLNDSVLGAAQVTDDLNRIFPVHYIMKYEDRTDLDRFQQLVLELA